VPAHHYHFITSWWVDAPIEVVWAALSDARTYLEWWPQVYLEVRVEGEGLSPGRRSHFRTRGWLPYELHWTATVARVEPPRYLESIASGDFVGRGEWFLEPRRGGTQVRLDWEVDAEKPLLRSLSPILKPLFRWNHGWAMRRAMEGLEPYCRARLGQRA